MKSGVMKVGARKSYAKPCLALGLVLVLLASNIGLFIDKNTSTIAPTANVATVVPGFPYEPPIHVRAVPQDHSHSVRLMERMMMMPQQQEHQRVGTATGPIEFIYPVWRHLVDCPAGSAALCDTSRYEDADESWTKGPSCAAARLVDIPSSSRKIIHPTAI